MKLNHAAGSLAAASLLLASIPASADEPQNMSAGMATQMQNAFPVPYRAVQLQTVFRVEARDRAGELYRLEPEFRWGLVRDGFVLIRPELRFGPGEGKESGNLRVQGFYNFTQETQVLPATALVVGTTLPTGNDAAGVDGLIRGILTKSAGPAQFNLNAEVTKMGGVRPMERDVRYRFGLGTDYGARTMLRTGLFVERAESRGGTPMWSAQAGLFHHLNPTMAIALGAEVGLSRSAPDYQIILGYQQTFSGF